MFLKITKFGTNSSGSINFKKFVGKYYLIDY